MKNSFISLSVSELKEKYGFKDVRDWQVASAKEDVTNNPILNSKIFYRLFDNRWTLYTGKTKGIQGYPRLDKMQCMLGSDNVALITCKQQSTFAFQHAFCTRLISDINSISLQSKEISYVFPLYAYDGFEDNQGKMPNFNAELTNVLIERLHFSPKPQDVFDYVYAILYSNSYRSSYKEFLKIDFPRIPYPKAPEPFHRLAEKGAELRKLHLMEGAESWKPTVSFPVVGENNENPVEAVSFSDGKVYINKTQYFGNVSELAWNFYIGGYQPAQKWLKDRKGRKLEWEDVVHYGRIIYALNETDRLMKEIDEIVVI